MVNVSGKGTETSFFRTYPTDLQDLRASDCCGFSEEEGEDSEEDTGEDTYVDELMMMMMTVTLKVT